MKILIRFAGMFFSYICIAWEHDTRLLFFFFMHACASHITVFRFAYGVFRDVLGSSEVIALIHSRCVFWAGSIRDSGMDAAMGFHLIWTCGPDLPRTLCTFDKCVNLSGQAIVIRALHIHAVVSPLCWFCVDR
jgi:hypothetical protein